MNGSRPLRLALVTPEYVTEATFDGGLANYTHRVALALKGMGHTPEVFVASDHDETLDHKGIRVARVNINWRWQRLADRATLKRLSMSWFIVAQSLRLNAALRRAHQATPYDLVQYSHLGAVGLMRPSGLPAVARLSSYTPWFNQWSGEAAPRHGWQQHFWEMQALKRADGVFGPSRLIAEVLNKDLGRPVEVIESPFTLDTDHLEATPYQELLADKRYLLFFGTLSELKGVVALAVVLRELLDRHRDVFFVFAGKQSLPYRGAPIMEHVWRQAGPYRGRVLYLGPMHHEQLYPILQGAAGVVLPSRMDNFPNTCIEAMAFGQVVIGTYDTSFEQLLTDGVSGFLCKRDNPESLLATIERLLALAPAHRHAIGAQAVKRVAELAPERVVQALVDYYTKVLAQVGRGQRAPQP